MWKVFFFCLIFNLVEMGLSEETFSKIRTKRFSIFSLVQFPNSDCTLSTSTASRPMSGLCYTKSECMSNGGTNQGSCASGFGVCCFISVSDCGSTSSKNVSYIQNPGNPGQYSSATVCTYNFLATSDICQIRLDFNDLTLSQPTSPAAATVPNPPGNCATDRITFTQASNPGASTTFAPYPPNLCGVLTGTHMYLETGREVNAGSLSISLGRLGTVTATSWRIKVTQYDCGSPAAAPTDCLQYFTGVGGTFNSFNFVTTTGIMINNLNYNMCFRQELGYCQIKFSAANPASSTINTAKDFFLDAVISGPTTTSVSKRTCPNAGILVPSLVANINPVLSTLNPATKTNQRESYCGVLINEIAGNLNSGFATATLTPFNVGVFSVDNPLTANTFNVGFNLQYRQEPC